MVDYRSTDALASGKSYSTFLPYPPPVLIAGLIQHELVCASTQVSILRIVDETGSASVGDIVDGLGEHPNPTGAVLIMVDLGILAITFADVIDMHALVSRASQFLAPDHSDMTQPTVWHPTPPVCEVALPDGIEALPTSPFVPAVTVATAEARRGLGKVATLNRPGVYALIGHRQIYVGASASVGTRVASGQQPIADIKKIVVITDANNVLSNEYALAAERMLHARVHSTGAFDVMNELPMGTGIDAELYGQIDAFLGQACLTLRYHNVLFTEGTARSVLAGPRHEAGRVAPMRPFSTIPDGECVEMCFDDGLVALAAHQHDGRWILLQGSDIRIETAPSANSSVRFQRAAWLHAGLLKLSPDGRSYVTTRDLVFRSGSGAAQFCVGSKGRTRDSWQPIDADDGLHPHTAALIAA
ncbi:hypothetical protein VW29_17800 [Devosia limi DSM 17137]|uniref:Uncharacterized protein n=2 Tax=Devosia TaxID=46913 RepID=A0A0F5LB34_9HYPH|nr:hypothetical protein VW29_17800 [Devosia limi DSM 17137]SHF32283.1 hypothetical protein SAMN02745223_02349 [Devosia limi DSM 17137]